MSGVIVTVADARAAKLCVAGSRTWAARYGLDFRKFLTEGLPEEVLTALGDPLADRAVAAARARVEAESGG